MSDEIRRAVLSLLLVGVAPAMSAAQGLETLGTRAAALAAFVAVADDASAVAWNPSGLVSGPIFNITFGLGQARETDTHSSTSGNQAARQSATLLAIGTTPVGVSYYRLSNASLEAANPAVVGTLDREKRQDLVRTLVTSHLGVTVQQSVGEYLTLGATVKLVRGSVGYAAVAADQWDEAFEQANARDRHDSMRGDLDIGAMFAAGRVRAGVVVRNVTAPAFGDGGNGSERMSLERHVRVGTAWGDSWPGMSRLIVAFDADLTRVSHPGGERRDVAAGVERWLGGQRVGLRLGARTSTIGDRRPVMSLGGSFAVRAGAYVDAYIARGTRENRAWGVAARLSY